VQCIDRLFNALITLERMDSSALDIAMLRARYLILTGRATEATDLLDQKCSNVEDPTPCLRARLHAAIKSRDLARLEPASAAYLAMSCESSKECGKALVHVGDLLAQERDWLGAMKYYGRAAREYPSRTAWSRLSRAAKQAGHPKRAQEAAVRSQHSALETD
jgi:uncharacterized protein HemY